MKRFGVSLALSALLGAALLPSSFLMARAQEPTATTAKPATKEQQQAAPKDARVLIKDAQKKAGKKKKAILVVFHASWCGWCAKLDTFMESPEAKPILAENYEIIHLDVMENGPKKSLENPNGGDVLKELGGEKSGLPFYAVLNADGKKIGDSNVMPGDQNIGYPGAPEEIVAFEGILQKTAPKLDDAKRAKLVDWLKKNAPKQ